MASARWLGVPARLAKQGRERLQRLRPATPYTIACLLEFRADLVVMVGEKPLQPNVGDRLVASLVARRPCPLARPGSHSGNIPHERCGVARPNRESDSGRAPAAEPRRAASRGR